MIDKMQSYCHCWKFHFFRRLSAENSLQNCRKTFFLFQNIKKIITLRSINFLIKEFWTPLEKKTINILFYLKLRNSFFAGAQFVMNCNTTRNVLGWGPKFHFCEWSIYFFSLTQFWTYPDIRCTRPLLVENYFKFKHVQDFICVRGLAGTLL